MTSTPKYNHIPPRITREDFQTGRMKPGSYSYEDISAAVVDHLSRSVDELTPTQLEGINKFKYNGTWNLGNPENIEDLRKFFDIFNAVLFNGVLTGYERDLHWYEQTHFGGTEAAYCQLLFAGNVRAMDPRFIREYPLGPIWMRKRGTQQDPTAKIEHYLQVLVHEMLHALFVIYACSCKNGCEEKLYDAYYHWQGHCASWQAAAYAIERATQYNIHASKNGIPNLNLNLGRSISFAYDIVYGRGASIPAESELDRLGLNLADIKAHLAMHNTRKTVEQKKEARKQQLRMANRCLRDWWVADTDVEVMEECGSVDADRDDSDDSDDSA